MFASRSGKPPDGHGICYWRNGSKKYEGQWKNGNPHGHGLFIDLDGNVFEGEWQNGQMHGKGMCVTPDGEKYEGDFQNGTMHGNGIFTYPDGEKYEGQWQNGLMHGKGLTTWPNGQKYEGDYVEGEKHGCGVFTWQNGDKYDGQWQDDMMHGCGILMDRDYNIIHAGTWVDDEFVQDVRISYLDQCCVSCYAMSVTLYAILDYTIDSETLTYVFFDCCCCVSRYAWMTLSLAKTF